MKMWFRCTMFFTLFHCHFVLTTCALLAIESKQGLVGFPSPDQIFLKLSLPYLSFFLCHFSRSVCFLLGGRLGLRSAFCSGWRNGSSVRDGRRSCWMLIAPTAHVKRRIKNWEHFTSSNFTPRCEGHNQSFGFMALL